ncbi:trehalose operon repressor [Neobacillus sp. NPDC097160]|uniref:trehalose operon repressor n=1 Tax=Neobacillus sp. NPDC097160 TaxID=3364298 RepID=UPI0037F6D232
MVKNKFIKIYEDMAEQIRDQIEAGSMLPSEKELAIIYSTSRETIRKALKILSDSGYIHKVQGKGSIVLEAANFEFPASGIISFKELSKKTGQQTKTVVKELKKIRPTKDLIKKMKLGKEDAMWKIFRVREIEGEKITLDKDFLAEKYVPWLTKEICQDSIHEYLDRELGLTISFVIREILIEVPTEEDRGQLDLEDFHSIVVVKNYNYLKDASLFQYTESRHRPDKFRFVNFVRSK